jgi:hypothetical protein
MVWGIFVRKIRKHMAVSEANRFLFTWSNNTHNKTRARTCTLSDDAGNPVVDMRAIFGVGLGSKRLRLYAGLNLLTVRYNVLLFLSSQ